MYTNLALWEYRRRNILETIFKNRMYRRRNILETRTTHLINEDGTETILATMADLKPGDKFRQTGDDLCKGVWVAKGSPYLNEHGYLTVEVEASPS
jgi:hypothetical protein